MVPKADHMSLQRIAGFSEAGKGEYVQIDDFIRRVKTRAQLRQKIEDETFGNI